MFVHLSLMESNLNTRMDAIESNFNLRFNQVDENLAHLQYDVHHFYEQQAPLAPTLPSCQLLLPLLLPPNFYIFIFFVLVSCRFMFGYFLYMSL